MAFDKPQSRNEAILQNMLGANNELEPPKSRVEALLQDIAGQMPEANPSEGTTTGTLERLKIGDDIYSVEGGGSGTSDYDALNNKPQIAGITLSGNKSLADLGIASASVVSGILDGASIDSFADVETALAGKQDTLTFDDTPTDGSNNPVKSNGIYDALALKQDATDNSLETEAKTIVGAINEHEGDIGSLKSGFTDLDNEVNGDATVYPYADVITIEDAVPSNLADCSVKIEPVQDLHGYDKPWVGGAGKNKLPLTLDEIKAASTSGTWSGNAYTIHGVTYTILTDADNNVTGIRANGTSTSDGSALQMCRSFYIPPQAYTLSDGLPNKPSSTSYGIYMNMRKSGRTYKEFTTYAEESVSANLTLEDYDDINFGFFVYGNVAIDCIIYPMIRLATETDATFAPYTNICPISGHTEVDVQRDGKNLIDWNINTYANYLEVTLKQGNYTLSTKTATLYQNWYIKGIKPDDTFCTMSELALNDFSYASESGLYYGGNSMSTLTFSVPVDNTVIRIGKLGTDGTIPAQLEIGTTATTFEDYSGKTYTIALGDTIYGGTVDFNSGVMTVDRAIIDLGTLTYTYEYQFARFTSDIISAMKADEPRTLPLTCECYEVIDDGRPIQNVPDSSIYNRGGSGGVHIQDSRYTDPTDLATALDGMDLVYPLATPTTIQLTPQQIQLLKGQNTLTASTGQISVTVNGVAGAIGQVQEQVNELADTVVNTQTTDQSSTMVEVDSSFTFDVDEHAKAFAIIVFRYGIADSITVTHGMITNWNNNNELYFVTGASTNHVILKMNYNGTTKKCTATVKESTIAGIADTAVYISVVTMY